MADHTADRVGLPLVIALQVAPVIHFIRTQESVTAGKTLNDFYSCSVCFHRGLESYQHGTMSAIVSLLCISMFAVLWYM